MSRTFQTGAAGAKMVRLRFGIVQFSTKFDGLEAGLLEERLDSLLAERLFDGLAVERLPDAGGDGGGVLVALEVRAVGQELVAQLVGTGGRVLIFSRISASSSAGWTLNRISGAKGWASVGMVSVPFRDLVVTNQPANSGISGLISVSLCRTYRHT